MKLTVQPGKYIVAVSGGVDSMVLLDLLCRQPGLELIVAHFDHGIRADSASDARFVAEAAAKLGLSFEIDHGQLGPAASEEKARLARYRFLNRVCQKYEANKIITAHHRDDVIETAIINMLRGTGPRGLTAIMLNEGVQRPLLDFTKTDIKRYALINGITWREDPTNQDMRYLRNYVRARLVAVMTEPEKEQLLGHIKKLNDTQQSMVDLLDGLTSRILVGSKIDRKEYRQLPVSVGQALLHRWLADNFKDIDRKTVERLDATIRVGKTGTTLDINNGRSLKLSLNKASFDLPLKRG
jgi:tRNA(Ile)-lysidine synthetase-like protein